MTYYPNDDDEIIIKKIHEQTKNYDPSSVKRMCENCTIRVGRKVRVNGRYRYYCHTCWRIK